MYVPRYSTDLVEMLDPHGRKVMVEVRRKRRDATILRLQEKYHFRLA